MNYKGFFDGSSKGNPGPAQCGWAIVDTDDNIISHEHRTATEPRTNNYAEYMGLIELLKHVDKTMSISAIEIFGDSKLVIEQVKGNWKCKSESLRPLYQEAIRLYVFLNVNRSVILTWIPREKNTIADSLAQKGIL